MWRPSSDLVSEPGIKYLELMGIRLIRNMLFMRIVLAVVGLGMIITSIVFSILGVMGTFVEMYYVLGGTGGVFLLIAILQTIFGANKRYFNKIRDLRDSGATKELKALAYRGRGVKSFLAMYALVDLGEMNIMQMRGMQSFSSD
jgi:hypothetical protein